MTLRNLTYMARIAEQNAAIARMQADNHMCMVTGQPPVYVGGHFLECEQELSNIANEMRADQQMGMQ